MRMDVHVHFRVYGEIAFVAGHFWVVSIGDDMPCPDAHYTLSLINHKTEERLKIELIDLPFPGTRSYRMRVPVR